VGTADRSIDELAQAVLDGEPVDWLAAGSDADETSRRVAHLRIVARVAAVHQETGRHPDIWGHLRILEPIGRGASGTVYRAWDTRLDREVALKLIPVEAAATGGHPPAVIKEGRLLAKVRHPNVATIHGADQIGAYVGLWMELVRGQTLEGLLRGGAHFEPDEVAQIGLELGKALSAVHAAGLLHRDIKAQNVMRADDGRIVLMDFGTGRELGERGSDLTGTPLYLAPEVLQGHSATIQSDIYSLGVLLYRLLTGSFPVHGKTVDEVRRAHQANQREDVRVLRADVSSRLAHVIARTMDPVPEARYSTAAAFGADVAKALRSTSRTGWVGRGALVAAILVGVIILGRQLGWLDREPGGRQSASPLASALGAPSRPALRPGERPVIAIQPFRNRVKDPDSDLIVEGLMYELTRSLAGLDGLDARAASSSFAAKDQGGDPQAFGRQLGANLVLAGSVFGLPSRLRVDAHLVRVADNVTVWAESFQPANNDPLAIQQEISLGIINKLRLRGLGRRRYQLDPALSSLFLTARGLQARRHTDNAGRAARLFEQIAAADPSFAPAFAGLASALSAFSMAVPGNEPPPPDPRMKPAALRAIQLDPFLADAHAAMGSIYAQEHDWENARVSFTTAMDLDPTLTTAHAEFVLTMLLPLDRIDEALSVMEEARTVDPMSLDVRRVLSLIQVHAGLYDQAIENSRWVLDRDPRFPYADLWLARALILSGRPLEAEPIVQDRWDYLGYVYAVTGRRDEAEVLAAAHPEAPARQMLIYGGLGDRDRAFEALERAAAQHWWRAATWMIRPEVKIVRSHPRYSELRKRMGLLE
jgi:serine/threonine-protein kinase